MHCCRPATQGCLDPYTPQIGISEAMEAHEAPADDLPYYFATIVDENHVERNPSAASEVGRQHVFLLIKKGYRFCVWRLCYWALDEQG